MPKINQKEYEVLKELDDKWKYLARNNMYGAKLEAHTSRPYKMTDSHWSNGYMTLELLGGEHLFQFIQWEDESSYNIQELIEEYLYDNQPKLFIDGQEQSFEFIEESEEKEVKKNIEWLKEQVKEKYEYNREKHNKEGFEGYAHRELAFKYALGLLDQLDEPEVLSQKWISENVEYAYFDMLDGSGRLSSATAIIKPEKLQNLLVPKQKLPVLPNYVAEWISEHREEFDLYPALRRLEAGSTRDYPAYKWYRKNTRNFVNAYLTGEYEIEREPKYYVLSKELSPMLCKSAGTDKKIMESNTQLTINEKGLYKEQYALTEQEIKDYDERYMNFAVKVEELEE